MLTHNPKNDFIAEVFTSKDMELPKSFVRKILKDDLHCKSPEKSIGNGLDSGFLQEFVKDGEIWLRSMRAPHPIFTQVFSSDSTPEP